jgi:hypothetical protein
VQARGRFSGGPFYARAAATEPRNRFGVAVRAVTSEPDRKARWRFSSGRAWRPTLIVALSIVQTRGGFRAAANFCVEKGAHLRPALPPSRGVLIRTSLSRLGGRAAGISG